MRPDILSSLFDINASKNAGFTSPNTAHKFSSVAQSLSQSVSQSRKRSLKPPFYCFDFSFGAPLALSKTIEKRNR